MIEILVYLLIFVICASVGWWILSQFPLPAPLDKFVLVIFVVVCAIVLIMILMQLVGGGVAFPRLR